MYHHFHRMNVNTNFNKNRLVLYNMLPIRVT
jgi:hypothetical protein